MREGPHAPAPRDGDPQLVLYLVNNVTDALELEHGNVREEHDAKDGVPQHLRGWRRVGGGLEEGWRRVGGGLEGGGLEEGWRRVGVRENGGGAWGGGGQSG